eukprot:2380015-Karenia_brevis.AAC.1
MSVFDISWLVSWPGLGLGPAPAAAPRFTPALGPVPATASGPAPACALGPAPATAAAATGHCHCQ